MESNACGSSRLRRDPHGRQAALAGRIAKVPQPNEDNYLDAIDAVEEAK
ncbi:hypothetical protein SLV14_001540 [Streptomyces sp. Je 1-4]|nr:MULTISPECIES: hypothetical protein [unclassified Streptomyces]UYB39092.1 hypothetical protein SLV14_001540 [Streptomyces sp. Je 1-4]UZQ35097.1 hypothetical protein SLV14N_001540 [Streptomyces sp. Je 1-4] [Streptomyces sp. Je 1-4 4N24]UZQ42515.1 hypothetical protein SLV14NA_001540 [Streptomyces sp. Je 1-4] [Streptomyces sp. Je 1-4 4N24_ara]